MKIQVTQLANEVCGIEEDRTEVYDFSNNNADNRWACMRDGGVHMWVPIELVTLYKSKGLKSGAIITSGRNWQLLED